MQDDESSQTPVGVGAMPADPMQTESLTFSVLLDQQSPVSLQVVAVMVCCLTPAHVHDEW